MFLFIAMIISDIFYRRIQDSHRYLKWNALNIYRKALHLRRFRESCEALLRFLYILMYSFVCILESI